MEFLDMQQPEPGGLVREDGGNWIKGFCLYNLKCGCFNC